MIQGRFWLWKWAREAGVLEYEGVSAKCRSEVEKIGFDPLFSTDFNGFLWSKKGVFCHHLTGHGGGDGGRGSWSEGWEVKVSAWGFEKKMENHGRGKEAVDWLC